MTALPIVAEDFGLELLPWSIREYGGNIAPLPGWTVSPESQSTAKTVGGRVHKPGALRATRQKRRPIKYRKHSSGPKLTTFRGKS